MDVVTAVFVLEGTFGVLSADHHRRVPGAPRLDLPEREGAVLQRPRLVAVQPLLLGEREPSQYHAHEVVRKGGTEEARR